MKTFLVIASLFSLSLILVIIFGDFGGEGGVPPATVPVERVDYVNNEQILNSNFHTKQTIYTKGGLPVKINNFLEFDGVKTVGEGMFHIDGLPGDPTAPTGIFFNANNSSFAIAIEAEPISDNHEKVSEAFRIMLGLSEPDACKLNVFIGVPNDLNSNYSGKNLGLSFCEDSIELP